MSITKEEQLLYLGKIFTSWPFVEKKWTFSTEEPGAVSSDPEHHVIERTEWLRARNDYLVKMSHGYIPLVHEPVMIKMVEPVIIDDNHDHSWYERRELPPVGCVCELSDEVNNNRGERWTESVKNGVRVKILCHYNPFGAKVAVFSINGDVFQAVAKGFRPLRTDREKAIEDMSRIIHEHGGVINDISLGALLDAGYHKGKTE